MSGTPTPVQAIDGVHHKFNYDNIFIRTVIAGVINILNDRVYLIYRLSDTDTKELCKTFTYNGMIVFSLKKLMETLMFYLEVW